MCMNACSIVCVYTICMPGTQGVPGTSGNEITSDHEPQRGSLEPNLNILGDQHKFFTTEPYL